MKKILHNNVQRILKFLSPIASRLLPGFTLVELLVVIGIMLVISSMLLVRNSQFNSSILLRALAYEVAAGSSIRSWRAGDCLR